MVPSIEYFNFTSSDTYQYLTVRLQTSSVYDIAAVETIRIAFSSDAASSGLAPLFELGDGTFSFQIVPSAGRLVVSGQTTLTEKLIREGGSVVYLSLFGEKWTSSAAQCVRSGISISTSDSRNELLGSTILPTYGSGMSLIDRHTLAITLSSARSGTNVYVLGSDEFDLLVLNVSSLCVVSAITPLKSVKTLTITRTRGELTLGGTIPAEVTEEVIRTQPIQIQLVVDGASWTAGIEHQPRSTSLLQGFSSTSSPLEQPSGFLVHRDALFSLRSLTVAPDILKTNKSITVRTVPQPTYDITEDELVTFTITDASFIANGELPSPAQISFLVKALPQAIVLMYQPQGGQYAPAQLEASVERLLSVESTLTTTTTTTATANATTTTTTTTIGKKVSAELLSQNGLLYTVSCRLNVTPSDSDPRTSVELLNALLALDPQYLYGQTGIKCASISASTLCAAESVTPSPESSQVDDDAAMTIAYWLIGAVSVLAFFVLVIIVAFLLHKRDLGGGLRSGSHTFKMGRRTRIPQYLTGQGPTTSQQPVASRLLTPMSLRDFARSSHHLGGATTAVLPSQRNANAAYTNAAEEVVADENVIQLEQARNKQRLVDERYRKYEHLLKHQPRASVSVQHLMELER